MRLLNTTTFALEVAAAQTEYAILSHRWIGDLEVTFQDLGNHVDSLQSGRISKEPVVDKIRGACKVARDKGIQWLWMDTCCIDKTSGKEYSEAINSMFSWYRNAKVCITFLADVRQQNDNSVVVGKEIFYQHGKNEKSDWFKRGWTLQEMLAPREMDFYDANWQLIGTKRQLAHAISEVTGINAQFITGERDLSKASIAMKMSWMSGRETTMPEDMSYSMIGLFNINMPLVYGEGAPRAFRRMQEIILASPYMDESLFAWQASDEARKMCNMDLTDFGAGEWGLLAGSPSWFETSGNIEVQTGLGVGRRTFNMTPNGIEAPILWNVRSGKSIRNARAALIVLFLTIVGAPVSTLLGVKWLQPKMAKRAREPHPFVLNCFRRSADGQLTNVAIYLQAVHVAKELKPTRIEGGKEKIIPYMECKRIWCNELSLESNKVINLGMGIVYQPPPSYFSV